MPAPKLHLLNWFLLIVATLLLCSFQTTFWFQVVGGVTAPMLWLLVFLYITLYRTLTEAIFINYALALVISPFTSMGLGTLWTIALAFTLIVSFVKVRVFWPGTRYFIAASALATIAFHVISWTLSRMNFWRTLIKKPSILSPTLTSLCRSPRFYPPAFPIF